jgi:hypothetical protein
MPYPVNEFSFWTEDVSAGVNSRSSPAARAALICATVLAELNRMARLAARRGEDVGVMRLLELI